MTNSLPRTSLVSNFYQLYTTIINLFNKWLKTFIIKLLFSFDKLGSGYPAYEQPPPSFRQQGSQQGSFNGSSGGNGYGGPPASSGYGGPSSFGGNCLIFNKFKKPMIFISLTN